MNASYAFFRKQWTLSHHSHHLSKTETILFLSRDDLHTHHTREWEPKNFVFTFVWPQYLFHAYRDYTIIFVTHAGLQRLCDEATSMTRKHGHARVRYHWEALLNQTLPPFWAIAEHASACQILEEFLCIDLVSIIWSYLASPIHSDWAKKEMANNPDLWLSLLNTFVQKWRFVNGELVYVRQD